MQAGARHPPLVARGVAIIECARAPFPYARIMAAHLTSSEIDGKL